MKNQFANENIAVWLQLIKDSVEFDMTYLKDIKDEAERQNIIHHMQEIHNMADVIISFAESIEL
jgi:hypothetical protein